ncbi:unnamed protein product [Soboliphyme baturini]|uniref:Deacetylase sirtuin-type domain-containing protein n=1 Tax=Soboliphyme baturini TaxID=241478 RepID=A0A183IKE0_9BILA|nr:unnamed protein product [Soboliphyme baturini]
MTTLVFESFKHSLSDALHELSVERPKPLKEPTVDALVEFIKTTPNVKIVFMCGAGISTAAGIPDFRSPKSGIYANLDKFDLPYPEAVFDINFFKLLIVNNVEQRWLYFQKNPAPFFHLAKSLLPKKLRPTISHYFMRLMNDKGMLLRVYSQNIDGLEKLAGIPEEKIVEAHGTFYTSHCLTCNKCYSLDWLREKLFNDVYVPRCNVCQGIVKPDVVFFSERLPDRFFQLSDEDFADCDVLIVMGTSLIVTPFATLVDKYSSTNFRPMVSQRVPRLLINKELVGMFLMIFPYD